MNHNELLELAARELAEALQQIEARGTCTECLAELLQMVAEGMRQGWADSADLVSGDFTAAG